MACAILVALPGPAAAQNTAPRVQNPIPDLDVPRGTSQDIDISSVFVDDDGDALTYTVQTTNPICTVSLSGATVTVGVPATSGDRLCIVVVIATDPQDLSAMDQFYVTPTAGLVVVTPLRLYVAEGRTAPYSVRLTGSPIGTVTITLSSSDASVATVPPATLTFTDADYARPQTVTVTGVADSAVTPPRTARIRHGVSEDCTAAFDPDLCRSLTYDGISAPSVQITVVDPNYAPPVANRAPAVSASCDPSAVFPGGDVRLRAKASDPDGDALTYTWSASAGSFLGAADGATARWTAPAETGPVTLSVRVSDPEGATATATCVVEVVNAPPAANDDEVTTLEDQPVTVDVLANDTDPYGNGLRIVSVSPAANGTAEVTANGVLYTPRANYHGADRFTYVAAGPEGMTATGTVFVTVLPVNDAPVAVGAIPDQLLDEGGGEVTVDVGPYFVDIDGDVLTYRAVSSDAVVVTTALAGTVLTLTPVEYGSAVVTVTAEDPDGLTAVQTFVVGVSDRLVRALFGNALAAQARSHLASVRMALGRRVTAGTNERSRLTVLGRQVPLENAPGRTAAWQSLVGWLPGARPYGLPGAGRPPADLVGLRPMPTSGRSAGFGGLTPPPPPSPSLPVREELLHGTEFLLALGGEEADADAARQGRRWQVWGQGDIQTFEGAPTATARYDGQLRTAYVGVDTWLNEGLLAGVAVARSDTASHWRVGGSHGTLTGVLTAAHPYLHWSDGATSVWAAVGGGWGWAKNLRRSGRLGTSGLELQLGMAEVRRQIGTARGVEFGVRADGGWAQLRTEQGEETVDAHTAAISQARVGADMSVPLRFGGLGLALFTEAHLRRDAGAGQTGDGMEVVAGVRAAGGIVRIDTQARLLVLHSVESYRERGVGVTLSVGNRSREGLLLSVSPRWGDEAAGGGQLWQDQVYRRYLPGAAGEEWGFDARADYGMRLRNGRPVSWFGSVSHTPYGRRFLVGGRVDAVR